MRRFYMVLESSERVKVKYHLDFSPLPTLNRNNFCFCSSPILLSVAFFFFFWLKTFFLIQCDKTSVICKLIEHKVFHYKMVIHHWRLRAAKNINCALLAGMQLLQNNAASV